MEHTKTIIGRVERIDFIDGNISGVPAKVDTGAYSSSVWASDIRVGNGKLKFKLFAPQSGFYTGQEQESSHFTTVVIKNSFGQRVQRYKVELQVRFAGKVVRSQFTLADRSEHTYPVLIGRRLLKGHFVVDVAEGQPIEGDKES